MLNNIIKIIDIFKWYLKTYKLKVLKKNNGKTLIIPELNTSLLTVKINIIFAKCFQYLGYQIIIIFKRKSKFYEQYYKCVGINLFFYLETKQTSEKLILINKIMKKSSNSKDFLQSKIMGISVGKWIASRIVRELKVGVFEIINLNKKQLLLYVSESINALFTIRSILDLNKNCSIMFNERGYSPSGEIFEYCLQKKINTVQWLGSPLDNHHSFKRYIKNNKDYHPLTLSKKSFKYLLNHPKVKTFEQNMMSHLKSQYENKKWFNRQNLLKNKKIYTKIEIINKLNLNPKKKIAVIFSHIMYDATFFYGESIFSNYEIWLKETLKTAAKNKTVNWILKIHPANQWRNEIESENKSTLEKELVNKLFKKLPENIYIIEATSDISTYSLFNSIDYGLTVRGTIGCELACFGIPVFTAGTGRYSEQGFTIDSKSKKSFENKIENIQKYKRLSKEKIKKARIYTYGSLIAKSIPMDGININYNINNKINPYHSDISFERISVKELVKKLDIMLFLKWFDDKNYHHSDEDLLYLEDRKINN